MTDRLSNLVPVIDPFSGLRRLLVEGVSGLVCERPEAGSDWHMTQASGRSGTRGLQAREHVGVRFAGWSNVGLDVIAARDAVETGNTARI